MKFIWTAIGAALLGSPALAAPPAEWIGQGPLPGLIAAFHEVGDGSMIVERVPRGESVERWTRMVVTQRLDGVIARGGTLSEWRGHFLDGLRGSCPGAHESEPGRIDIQGRPAITLRVDCPRNPATGRPETFLLRAIAGGTDLHVAQVAFRHVPTAQELTWARGHLATVTLCTRRVKSPICGAGPEAFDR
jgi:hypothetical protein